MSNVTATAAAKILVITEAGIDLLRMQRELILQGPEDARATRLERMERLGAAMEETRQECITILGGLL